MSEPTLAAPAPSHSNSPETKSPATTVRINHAHNFIFGYLALILLAAALAGVYSWQHRKVNDLNKQVNTLNTKIASAPKPKISSSTTSATKTWTDSKVYSLTYPASWTVGEMVGDDATPGSAPTITFTPQSFPSDAQPIYVNLYTTSNTANVMKQYAVPANATISPQSLTINGSPALYYQAVVPATSVSGSIGYSDDFYAVSDSAKNITLLFQFRESQTAGKASGETTYNNSSFVSSYTTFVKSTQFLPDSE